MSSHQCFAKASLQSRKVFLSVRTHPSCCQHHLKPTCTASRSSHGLNCFQSGAEKDQYRCKLARQAAFKCRAEENDSSASPEEEPKIIPAALASQGGNSLGRRAALGAVGLGVAAFATTRLSTGEVSLKTLEQQAEPLDAALSNQRPTVVEFYANWCEVCRELTPEVYKVEQEYKDRINFVMLNIENPKWAPEMAEYRVTGIPHFVFLDGKGRAEAAAVGRLPTEVLQRNVKALLDGKQPPFKRASGEVSTLSRSNRKSDVAPRSHS